MRISDWSSDVCSSDLDAVCDVALVKHVVAADREGPAVTGRTIRKRRVDEGNIAAEQLGRVFRIRRHGGFVGIVRPQCDTSLIGEEYVRSEEHTSELQSLMRISYAVFCLKKKTNNSNIQN